MTPTKTDLLVAGGGIAGMIASLVFAREGFKITCVEAAPRPSATQPQDLRSTAFLMPSIRLLRDAGIFAGLEDLAAPLKTMRIIDAGGADPVARQTVDFEASEADQEQFGWNIPNAPLRAQLLDQITQDQNINMIFDDAVEAVTTRLEAAIVRLKSGVQIAAHLVVGADGRHSRLRQIAGIDVTTLRYGQKALVFQVEHNIQHQGISTEIHRTGGPFTLVPLAGHDQTRSAVVWMTEGPEADRLVKLTDPLFEEAVNTRATGVMGRLTLASQKSIWPIISQFADRLIAQKIALIGEAAHVVPPIGAQGLNMSLADIACLRDLISDTQSRASIGSDLVLEAYERQRWPDMRAKVQAIDALNRTSMAKMPILRDARASLLALLGQTAGLKRAAIRAGLGQ